MTTSQIADFNSFIEQAKQTIMCDSECQKQQGTATLQQKYLYAQTNLETAPNQVKQTQKDYIVFSQGQQAYNNFEDKQIYERANKMIDVFNKTFQDASSKITSDLFTYENLLSNFKNVIDLYIQYKKENIYLFNELKTTTSDVITNDRKTYYEEQGIQSLKFVYYYFLLFIYSLFVIIYIIISFVPIWKSQLSFKSRIFMLIGLLILPFISTWIISLIIYLSVLIYSVLPKNSYLTL